MPVNPVTGSGGVDYGSTVFTDKQSNDITAEDFLQLMVAQLRNQDFMNPVDDTQYLSQLAQFSSMQYMQEMAERFQQNYVLGLVGQNVTAAKFKVNGEIDSVTGVIDRISLMDNEYLLYIGDKSFSLEQIMTFNAPGTGDSDKTGGVENAGQTNVLLSLMGKMATVKSEGHSEITGLVERVSLKNGLKFMVDGEWYELGELVAVDPAPKEEPADDADKGDPDETVPPETEEQA